MSIVIRQTVIFKVERLVLYLFCYERKVQGPIYLSQADVVQEKEQLVYEKREKIRDKAK